MRRWDKVNERQLAILKRIAAGDDLAGDANIPARTSAGALRNRGLVTIHRRGGSWDAEITEAGRFYLANGHHPDDPKYQTPKHQVPKPEGALGRRKAAVVRKPTITDQRQDAAKALIERLVAERRVSLKLDVDGGLGYWRRVIDFAKRHGMAPEGARIVKSQPFPGDELVVELVDGVHPNSASVAQASPVVPVPDQLRSLHPVVAALKADKQRLMMPASIRHRSLRVLQALAAEMTKRGHTIRPHAVAERHTSYHYAGRHELRYARRDGQIDVVIGENTYEVSISQESPNSADEEKAARLLLELSGYRAVNRYRWADRKRKRVEDWLGDVCDELEARATADDQHRIDQIREAAERRTRWQAAMDRARFHALESHRTEVLTAQVEQWNLANAIRTYCDALGQRLAQIEDPDESATEWLIWARARAVSLDPLSSVPTMPPDREFSAEELKPYLGRWSPYGPDTGWASWR